MDALWALGSILGILGVVLVGGYILAVLVNMIGGAFAGSDRSSKKSSDILDYSEYKSLENENAVTNENILANDNTVATVADEQKAEVESKKLEEETAKDEFKLEDAVEHYKTAAELAREIEKDLGELKNEIEVLSEDFSK